MFVDAIVIATEFTRPIHFAIRSYAARAPYAGAATLFFVNDEACALTCRHVAQELLAADQVNTIFAKFRNEIATPPKGRTPKQWRKDLERSYGYKEGVAVQMLAMFVNCADRIDADVKMHQDIDVALIHFNAFSHLGCSSFPVFAAQGQDLKQGKYLCRLRAR